MRKVSMVRAAWVEAGLAELFAGMRVEGAEGEEAEGEGDEDKVVHDGESIAPRGPRA